MDQFQPIFHFGLSMAMFAVMAISKAYRPEDRVCLERLPRSFSFRFTGTWSCRSIFTCYPANSRRILPAV